MGVLVTGAAGFVGSHLVRRLLSTTDEQVTAFDALTYAGLRANLAGLDQEHPRRYRFVHGDITDRAAVRAALAGHHTVLHLAGESHVDRSLDDPRPFERANSAGTAIVCDEAARAGVDRFVHVSTDEVYGPILHGAATEDHPLAPTSPYAASKARSDLIALDHHLTHGLPVVVTRSSNQFGPRQFPEKLIPRSAVALLCGGNVALYGDGLHVRDWLHVADNCAAIDLVRSAGEPGQIYNVGGHCERTNRQVIASVLGCLGLDWSRVEMVSDRPGHDRRYAMDTTKVEALGSLPSRCFEQALEDTVRWYVDHQDWWEPLLQHLQPR